MQYTALLAAALGGIIIAGCAAAPVHSSTDYANAAAVGDASGSLTTIVGPATAIIEMRSAVKFPEGDTASGVRSVLMYDGVSDQPGFCLFQIGHAAQSSSMVTEAALKRPCDGKHWARFRIAGTGIGFISHLVRTSYKNTPVTLLEITDHQAPDSIRVVY